MFPNLFLKITSILFSKDQVVSPGFTKMLCSSPDHTKAFNRKEPGLKNHRVWLGAGWPKMILYTTLVRLSLSLFSSWESLAASGSWSIKPPPSLEPKRA